MEWRELAIQGGQVARTAAGWRLVLPALPQGSQGSQGSHGSHGSQGYADAQLDDYGGRRRQAYRHRPGTHFSLQARFSHPAGVLQGTAGFGFWNAPFGDPTVPWPALPQAAWFFYASAPADLPLALDGPGRGWFAATLDATTPRALAWAPFAPLVLLLNQWPPLRRRLWPLVRRSLGISFEPLPHDLTAWHTYELDWHPAGCFFRVDGRPVLQTPFSPRGPLGFVAWVDNQYLITTPAGRFGWGTLPTGRVQWLELANLQVSPRRRANGRNG